MLRGLIRLLTHSPQRPSLIVTEQNQVVLYAQIGTKDAQIVTKGEESEPTTSPQNTVMPFVRHASTSHRARVMSMHLEHTNLCSPRRCTRFRDFGIITAGDLSLADPVRLASRFGAPRKALGVIKQYRRAIRFAAAVPGMMPRDALLLISIHRRSVRGLASESAAALHRDLERFAESSKGRLQLRGRRVPSTRRLRRWISHCEAYMMQSNVTARAA